MSKINPAMQSAAAFAPATSANVAVGFDILGFALETPGDWVRLTRREDSQIVIESIKAKDTLPCAVHKNTASIAVAKLCRSLNLNIGFSIHIEKGIPLCSGMGGSAASAVAALVACNQFLNEPLPLEELAYFALYGERAASGAMHYDNIIPCLYGGLTLIHRQQPLKVVQLPIPELYVVIVHPHLRVSTRKARQVLQQTVALKNYVQQSAKLASFIAALYTKDYLLLRESLSDLIIEPQRAQFVPGFYEIKEAALEAGALGMSFSGSGPALFAFAASREEGAAITEAMSLVLHKQGIASDAWLAPISRKPAHISRGPSS